MTAKRKLLLKIAVAVMLIACVAGVIVLRSTRFQIAYHDRAMRRAWDACLGYNRFVDTLTTATGGNSCERFEYHRQSLKSLGAVNEFKFQLQHIRDDSRAAAHFRELVYGSHCPASIHWAFATVDGTQPVKLTVWCYTEDTESWNRFIAARDVPDYETKFMDASKNTPAAE